MFVLGAVSSFRLHILSSASGLTNSAFLFIDSCSLYNAINAPLMRMRHYKILERVSFSKVKFGIVTIPTLDFGFVIV